MVFLLTARRLKAGNVHAAGEFAHLGLGILVHRAHRVVDGSGNQITIKASGNIKLDGQQVDVSGKSAVNVKASGQLNLEASGVTNVKGAMVKVN